MYYLTTAINYTNGLPHIGHCYELILADCIARYQRLFGKSVYFITGTDEHGIKIYKTAKKNNKEPMEICDYYSQIFQDLASKLESSNDFFIRTTMDIHKERVITLFQKMKDKDDIYLGEYEGWYNPREETYISEYDAKLCNYHDPVSGSALIKIKEPSYFFRLSKYQSLIIEHLQNCSDFIKPESYKQELLNRLKNKLNDLSISRTSFNWGIAVPNDAQHCIYVWFDALINYYTASQMNEKNIWPPNLHIIGKDILWFHAVIWPSMLLSAELSLPKQIYIHNFITDKNGYKMSKSIGNTIDIFKLFEEIPITTFRYYLLRNTSPNTDINFNLESLKVLHNGELIGAFGNLVHRILGLNNKFFGGIITETKIDKFIDLDSLVNDIKLNLKQFRFNEIINRLLKSIHDINQYIDKLKPWREKISQNDRAITIKSCLEALYIIVRLWEPIEPSVSKKILEQLGVSMIRELKLNWNNINGKTIFGKHIYQKI